jgi:endogenous inhibitor of DNA gyrase (YacG/DUF329 family)
VPCPRCGAAAAFTADNKWRPFCSERCKMIDLGLWGSDAYRVPAEEPPDEATGEPGEGKP